ncbi:MAG: hypothetical protein K2H99_05635, partial [Paramuribaculum sp.]|nr:hypothetical protein [Paramuribaculum sp.]
MSSDKEYSAIVAVEYDPTDHNYYFAPCEFQESFEKPELIIPEAEKDKYQVIKDENNKISEIIYTDEFLNGNISLSFSITKPSTLQQTAYYYPALKREDGSAVITPDNVNTNTFKLDFTTKQLTFDEETGAATVYASAYCKGNYNTTHDGHPLKITIRDAVQTGPEVVSIEEFRTKMQKGELSADKPVYVRFSGRFAVVARNGNVLQLRDVDKDLPLNPANASDTVTVFKDSYILVHDNDGWKQTYQKNQQTNVKERTGFPVLYQSHGMYGWEAYSKEIAIGEEITQFIGKVTIDEAGNYDIDLTGLGNFFTSWSLYLYHDDGHFENLDKLAVSGYTAGTPRFIPYMVSRDLDGNPVTDEQGNLVMREENCVNRPVSYALSSLEEHPDNHPENIELNDDLLDAQMKVMKVQVKKADAADDYTAQFTADGVTLLWDMFGTDKAPSEPETEAAMALADEADDTTAGDDTAEPAKSVKEQLADHIAAGTDHFDVTGILRKHTDGKYAIQVEKIIPTPVDSPARFFADGKEINGDTYGFVKRIDLTTDTPEGAVIKMTVGDGEQETYDPEKLKGIEADTKVSIKRSAPGVLERTTPTTITLTKLSTDVNTLAEMAKGDNADNLYHFRKHLK